MMKATEAAELTQKNLREGDAVRKSMGDLFATIRAAATRGERAIYFMADGVTHHQREGVLHQLRELGYKITYNAADQRDPRERDSWTVSW